MTAALSLLIEAVTFKRRPEIKEREDEATGGYGRLPPELYSYRRPSQEVKKIPFADKIVVTTLVENYVDMLIPNTENVKRPGLAFHFDPRNKPIQAENGISLLVDIYFSEQKYRILFDPGLTHSVILHNMSALGISPNEIDHAVISHGHPDHYGGLLGLLEARDYPLPVILPPNAFLTRYVVAGSGSVIPYYNQSFRKDEIEAAGGRLVIAREPVPIGPASFTTGESPLKESFEPPGPPSGILPVYAASKMVGSRKMKPSMT
ncbi:MAG: MBL fold metallo-hydrolase [Proteobacteria bacterium]|nr:MBL fold metallo-hydrolase [Pseudomonadota bacterium]